MVVMKPRLIRGALGIGIYGLNVRSYITWTPKVEILLERRGTFHILLTYQPVLHPQRGISVDVILSTLAAEAGESKQEIR